MDNNEGNIVAGFAMLCTWLTAALLAVGAAQQPAISEDKENEHGEVQ